MLKKKNMWHPPVESFSPSAKNLLKSHKVERQKALGSFGEGRVVPLHGQDPPWSQSCQSCMTRVSCWGSLQRAVEGRWATRRGEGWLGNAGLPLRFRESELLKS